MHAMQNNLHTPWQYVIEKKEESDIFFSPIRTSLFSLATEAVQKALKLLTQVHCYCFHGMHRIK